MNTKILTLILMMFFSVSISAQIKMKNDYKSELELIFKTFKEKNYELLKPLLDPNVKIGDLPRGMNDMIVPQIIEQFPEPVSYIIKNTITEGENTRIETIYNTALVSELNWKFTFNKEGKIIDFDILSDVLTETKQAENK